MLLLYSAAAQTLSALCDQAGRCSVEAWLIVLTVLALNLVFYTAYVKKTKSHSLSQLLDVLLGRRGIGFTLVELNKVIGLAGLVTLGLSILPIDM